LDNGNEVIAVIMDILQGILVLKLETILIETINIIFTQFLKILLIPKVSLKYKTKKTRLRKEHICRGLFPLMLLFPAQ
jgi:hypothetical protein